MNVKKEEELMYMKSLLTRLENGKNWLINENLLNDEEEKIIDFVRIFISEKISEKYDFNWVVFRNEKIDFKKYTELIRIYNSCR